MPVYFLEPKDGDTSAPDWKASGLQEGCWVLAETQEHAREIVKALTFPTPGSEPDDRPTSSPWTDPELVECREDDSYHLPEGVVVAKSGKTISEAEG